MCTAAYAQALLQPLPSACSGTCVLTSVILHSTDHRSLHVQSCAHLLQDVAHELAAPEPHEAAAQAPRDGARRARRRLQRVRRPLLLCGHTAVLVSG